MADFAPVEQSAPDHELVLDDELIQDQEEPVVRVERSRRSSRRRTERPERSNELDTPRPLVRAGDFLAEKYRVERVHQQGTLGVTVEAEHLQLGQRVAIKLLTADPAQHPEAAARFLRGARFAVQLRNEHVARVVDVGTLDSGVPYMVTEHLSGSDLRAVLRVREWLPVPEAVDYVLQACEALAEAHLLGFVHRNLKLSNLFLTRLDDGKPIIKLLDFCVSEGALGEAPINGAAAGAVVSSLAYLAPEQIRDPLSVDARADIWAMGAVLHELLTGVSVFAASTAPGLFAVIAADAPTPVTHLRREIPAELESVVLRCLEKQREDRFADIGDFARQLKPFASSEGRESVERIVLALERRARSTRSTRPPLPGSAESRSIIRVGTATAAEPQRRRRLLEIAAVGIGVVGCSIGIGALVAVHSLQSALASRVTSERNMVATLSPALTASPPLASSATAALPLAQPAVSPPAPPAPPSVKPSPRESHVVISDAPTPAKRAATGEPPEANIVADAKPAAPAAPRARGLFDDAN